MVKISITFSARVCVFVPDRQPGRDEDINGDGHHTAGEEIGRG